MNWNRVRYTVWAPFYDALVAAVGFGPARRESIRRLNVAAGDRVLLTGAGTGLDLEYLPRAVSVTAIDVTPAMLNRLRRRARRRHVEVQAHVMDARRLAFADGSFDAVVMHLILAVMPDPASGLREAERVLAPGGRIAVFDKFLGDTERAPLGRLLINLVIRPLFSDLNRRLGPLVAETGLEVVQDTPAAFGGMYRIVTLRKPVSRRES